MNRFRFDRRMFAISISGALLATGAVFGWCRVQLSRTQSKSPPIRTQLAQSAAKEETTAIRPILSRDGAKRSVAVDREHVRLKRHSFKRGRRSRARSSSASSTWKVASVSFTRSTDVGAKNASAQDEVPYAPSRFPGVMVRNVPQDSGTRKSDSGVSWIYREPGAPMPPFPQATTRTTPRSEMGKTRAGGVILRLDNSHFIRETARVTSSGVKIECEKAH